MSNNKIRLEATCFRPDQVSIISTDFPEIAVAGRSNVGKSSLINSLLGVKLAKTGQTPGKTRSINFYNVDEKFRLVDLPGYGYAARSKDERNKWLKLVEKYISERENLKFVCHLVDFRHGLLKNDRELQEWLNSFGINIFVVFTKADKISKGKWKFTRDNYIKEGLFSIDVPLITSAENKSGIDELKKFIDLKITEEQK